MQIDLFFFLKQDVDVVGNDILSLVYYFFNLMPLSRGSRYLENLRVFVTKSFNYYCHHEQNMIILKYRGIRTRQE